MTEVSPNSRSGERPRLAVGTRVEIRSGFDDTWTSGFAVEEITTSGYLLRRRLDDSVLPAEFEASSVRRERKSIWWV